MTPEKSRAIQLLHRELTNVADPSAGACINAAQLFDALCDGIYAEIKRRLREEADERARLTGRANLAL